jgi:hypothetical protein
MTSCLYSVLHKNVFFDYGINLLPACPPVIMKIKLIIHDVVVGNMPKNRKKALSLPLEFNLHLSVVSPAEHQKVKLSEKYFHLFELLEEWCDSVYTTSHHQRNGASK